MEFKFDFSLSEQDYLDFNMFHNFASKYGKKQFRRIRLLTTGIFLLAGIFYLLLMGFNADGFTYLGVFCLCAVLFYFIGKPMIRSGVKRQIKQLKKQGKLPYSSEATVTFSEDFFAEQTVINKSEYIYSAICESYLVNDRMFYFYLDTVRAYLLPVSAFASQEQLNAFLDFIEQKTVPVIRCDFERSPYMEPIFPENSNK